MKWVHSLGFLLLEYSSSIMALWSLLYRLNPKTELKQNEVIVKRDLLLFIDN